MIQHEKNCGTGLVPAKSTGSGPKSTGTGTEPEPEFRSGPSVHSPSRPIAVMRRLLQVEAFKKVRFN